MLNYRCTRFFFHPDKDRFVLCTGWKDPLWTDVHAIRTGIDADEKSHREAVFGRNLVDIEQPPVVKLLVEEVRGMPLSRCFASLTVLDSTSLLHISNRQPNTLVT